MVKHSMVWREADPTGMNPAATPCAPLVLVVPCEAKLAAIRGAALKCGLPLCLLLALLALLLALALGLRLVPIGMLTVLPLLGA